MELHPSKDRAMLEGDNPCKIHTIPILMHQMHISIIYISSVMLRPKKFEICNVMTIKTPNRHKMECHEMEPNPSKNRAMHDGDNPSSE
jgi:hypothetical protein